MSDLLVKGNNHTLCCIRVLTTMMVVRSLFMKDLCFRYLNLGSSVYYTYTRRFLKEGFHIYNFFLFDRLGKYTFYK